MNRIVCATSAGAASRAVHIAAFRRAAETSSALTFVHVLWGEDFDEQPDRMRAAIKMEMEWLLHVLVRVARDRSEATGVGADVVVRTGAPPAEILAAILELEPELLLIGVPREGDGGIFGDTSFSDFVAGAEELGVRVELVSTEPVE